jgi:hypothetical protein
MDSSPSFASGAKKKQRSVVPLEVKKVARRTEGIRPAAQKYIVR